MRLRRNSIRRGALRSCSATSASTPAADFNHLVRNAADVLAEVYPSGEVAVTGYRKAASAVF